MKIIKINYNPYFMKTKIMVNGSNIIDFNHCNAWLKNVLSISSPLPLQSWIEPIEYEEWNGLLDALCEIGDLELQFEFYGRKIDFQDLKESLELQNSIREEKAIISFPEEKQKFIATDIEMKRNIDEVISIMLESRFEKLVSKSNNDELKRKYSELRNNVNAINDKEFRIVFTGTYSSGKSSTINSLIGKNILPTSTGTCTARPCYIYHKSNNKENAEVVYVKAGRKEKVICKNDFEVQDAIRNANRISGIEKVIVNTNLEHLCPSGTAENFKLVIIDTPGTSSGAGNAEQAITMTDGSIEKAKPHIEITKEVLKSKEKEMVILVSDHKFEDESIIELLDIIEDSALDDDGAFNDRFLFVMNMCDNISYKTRQGESLCKSIGKFKDNILRMSHGSQNRNILNPRVFPISSGSALAIKSECIVKPPKEEEERRELFDIYTQFCNKVYDDGPEKFIEGKVPSEEDADSNYCLEKYCAITDKEKRVLFEQYSNEEFLITQKLLYHSGVPSLELAIKTYIMQYAYPIKVRALLKTFESILVEIGSVNNEYYRRLQKERKNLESASSQKEEEQHQAEKQKERKRKLDDARNEMEKICKEVKNLKSNVPEIDEIIGDYYNAQTGSFNLIPINLDGTVKSEIDINEAESIKNKIESVIERLVDKIKDTVNIVKEEKKKTAKELYEKFIRYIDELEKEGLFLNGRFDLKNTVEYSELVDDEAFFNYTSYDKKVDNPNKEHIEIDFGFGNFISSIGRAAMTLFEPSKIDKQFVNIHEYCEKLFDKIEGKVLQLISSLKLSYKNDINELKTNTNEKMEKVLVLVDKKQQELNMLDAEIREIVKTKDGYQKSVKELTDNRKFLNDLIAKIGYTRID